MTIIRVRRICDRCVEKRAFGANHQIRTAAPHFEMGLGHGWANFNTQSVQTLSLSRFVSSRGSANLDRWDGFRDVFENSSVSIKWLIDVTEKVPPERKLRSAQQRLILKYAWGMDGPILQNTICANIEFVTLCGLAKQWKPRQLAWI